MRLRPLPGACPLLAFGWPLELEVVGHLRKDPASPDLTPVHFEMQECITACHSSTIVAHLILPGWLLPFCLGGDTSLH